MIPAYGGCWQDVPPPAQPDAAEPPHTQAYAGVRDAEVADMTARLARPATLAATRDYTYTEL